MPVILLLFQDWYKQPANCKLWVPLSLSRKVGKKSFAVPLSIPLIHTMNGNVHQFATLLFEVISQLLYSIQLHGDHKFWPWQSFPNRLFFLSKFFSHLWTIKSNGAAFSHCDNGFFYVMSRSKDFTLAFRLEFLK